MTEMHTTRERVEEARPNPMTIQSVGVVGAGQMGSGITQVFAQAGFDVLLVDAERGVLEKALKTIDYYLSRQVARERISEAERQAASRRISAGVDFAAFSACDLVIEAVTEDEKIKRVVFKQICPHLKPEAILATNTSAISITRLAAGTDRPAQFIGMHFMNPAPLIDLVEVISGIATEEATFAAINDLVISLGKTPVRSADFSAFIVNRILMPSINEAVYALQQGVATVDGIDTAMRLGTLHPMGPLELADLIGLDTCLAIISALHDGFSDSKYRPCPLLVKYVEAGWLGRKAGRGFYDYSGDTPEPTR